MKIKLHTLALFAGSIALLLLAGAPSPAAGQMTRFDARSGSKMRLEGTSLVHDWQAQSTLIMGFLEVGPNFPTEPGQVVSPGKVEARSEASVKVKSLRSIEKNGAPYDDKMDAKMYSMLQETNHPTIVFRLSELVLKETPKDKEAPYVFDANGELAVAGVTNKISLSVNVVPLGETKGDTRLKITGSKALKMSDFSISPAQILFVKTSDDMKIIFEWIVGHRKPATADASK